ncbi:MAG TPA: hypothetical protein VGL81_18155 [Polyangiaceae bacterium]|jgi:hypothetical protein
MRRLGLLFASSVLVLSSVALAQTVPPPPVPPPPVPAPAETSASPFPAAGACLKDTDCKGERICVQGQCVEPPSKTPPPPPATTEPTPPAPPSPSATTAPAPPPPKLEPEWTPRGYATPRAAQPATSAWDRLGLHGIEVEVRLGFMLPDGSSPVQAPNLYPSSTVTGDPTGDILRGTEHPYGLEPLGIVVTAGYRLLPSLSLGAFFSYASFDSLDGTDTGDYSDSTSQLQRQMWTLGAYGRYYFTQFHRRLQPWVELGLGYSDDNASYVRGSTQASNGQPETSLYQLEEKGIVARLTAGLDWRLAPVFAVGPWVSYERVIPAEGCVQIQVDSESPVAGVNECGGPVQAHGYGVVSGGIALKLTVDPWPR